jgi:hypothetical protein
VASVIQGEWTHRRGDAGGARAVPAEIRRPKPHVAWSWRPHHGGLVDQVRVAGANVLVATMMPRDARAPGWEHAVVYAIDASTGAEIARRVLPDPVPVCAMVVAGDVLHVVGTRRGEPVFWYALSPTDLAARHRRVVALPDGARHEDVLEAFASPGGGLWLELDATLADDRGHGLVYAFVEPTGTRPVVARHEALGHAAASSRDACVGGPELFTPVDGHWTADAPVPPGLSRLAALDGGGAKDAASWAQATLAGPNAQIHALGGEGFVYAVAAAEDPERPERSFVEAIALDRTSGAVQWRAQADRVPTKNALGGAARVARRPNGELLFQGTGPDGLPRTPLLCARPDGRCDVIALGAKGTFVLDAALGDLVLAHRTLKDGRVEVGGFAIDREGRLLGRRAALRWTLDAGDLGGEPTVYAGAGAVVVRGARAVSAVRL